jgi:hypothetical protein
LFDDAAQARNSDGITATAEGQLEMPRHVSGIVLAGSAQPFAQVGSDRSDAILPRLRKDRPDLHARVLAGELCCGLGRMRRRHIRTSLGPATRRAFPSHLLMFSVSANFSSWW